MKRTIGLIMGVLMAVSIIGTVMTVSAEEPLESSSLAGVGIGIANAIDIALEDAGLTEADVEFSKKVDEYSDGRQIYDIHFMTRGNTKYEYEVDALTGDIVERDQEAWEPDDDMEYQGLADAGQDYFIKELNDDTNVFEEALQAAFDDAGLDASEIITYKFGANYENGKVVLDIGFIIPGQAKYDYDVELSTGTIIEKDQEPWEPDDDMEYQGLLTATSKETTAAAAAPAGSITDADAKEIALKDAGLAESDVNMIKCQKDFDDGIEKYDVDFFGPDGMKYEYDIRVSDGVIIEKDAEFDD